MPDFGIRYGIQLGQAFGYDFGYGMHAPCHIVLKQAFASQVTQKNDDD